METIIKGIGYALAIVGIALLMSVLLAYPVKWLWNYVMPYLFNLVDPLPDKVKMSAATALLTPVIMN